MLGAQPEIAHQILRLSRESEAVVHTHYIEEQRFRAMPPVLKNGSGDSIAKAAHPLLFLGDAKPLPEPEEISTSGTLSQLGWPSKPELNWRNKTVTARNMAHHA